MTAQEIISAVLAQFDVDQSTVLGWLNARLSRMVGESLWRAAEVTVGTTASGVARYALDDGIAELRRVKIGTKVYDAAGTEDIWALNDATTGAGLTGDGTGVFAAGYDADGDAFLDFFPVPSEDGDTITGLVALETVDLALGDTPPIPVDFHDYLVDGVIAQAYERVDERSDLAQVHEQRFEQGIVRLAGRRSARVGNGPRRAKVYGRDFF